MELRLGEHDELLVRSPAVMTGYWNQPDATARVIDADGWLHTGDQARIENGHIFITGRLKDIIVLANGEKVPPGDMEMAIAQDPLFEQVMVIGEGRPYLAVLAVPNRAEWERLARGLGVDPFAPAVMAHDRVERVLLERITRCLHAFPGYAQIRRIAFASEAWTVENGLLTPTLKPRRDRILAHETSRVARLYKGH